MKDYEFMLQVVEDGSVTFSRRYSSAVEAVHAFDKFKDYGMASYSREIVLLEPSGKSHAKAFDGPLALNIGVK